MCLWFPLYKPGNILYEAGYIQNRSLIRASNIKGNYSCDGLYALYKPGNKEVFEKNIARWPKGNIFFNTSELPGLYNAYRTMDHGIYDIS